MVGDAPFDPREIVARPGESALESLAEVDRAGESQLGAGLLRAAVALSGVIPIAGGCQRDQRRVPGHLVDELSELEDRRLGPAGEVVHLPGLAAGCAGEQPRDYVVDV